MSLTYFTISFISTNTVLQKYNIETKWKFSLILCLFPYKVSMIGHFNSARLIGKHYSLINLLQLVNIGNILQL